MLRNCHAIAYRVTGEGLAEYVTVDGGESSDRLPVISQTAVDLR